MLLSRALLLLAAMPCMDQPADLPARLVADVQQGRDSAPKGRVAIWRLSGMTWKRTEPVDAATVEWARLDPNDRIEVLS